MGIDLSHSTYNGDLTQYLSIHLWEQNLVAHADSEFFRVSLSNSSLSQGLLQFRQIGIPSDVVAYHYVVQIFQTLIQL